MQAMRLLVILSLIFSALVMVSPAAAAAPGERSVDCHAMAGEGSAGDTQHEREDLPPTLHACPGCAFLSAAERIAPRTIRPALPRTREVVAAWPSLASSPVPPPPRTS